MIRLTAPARLHFGLFAPESTPRPWQTATGESLSVRRFGGVGLMVRAPALILRAEVANDWRAEGPLAARALTFARRIAAAVGHVGPPLALTIEEAMPPHAGLGSGTQLGLTVARTLAALWNLPWTLDDLACWSGRGLRSGLGLHGFAQGGFLIEAGKVTSEERSLLLTRTDFPAEWAVVLLRPAAHERMYGPAEQDIFAGLTGPTDVAALARLVLLALLPAVLDRDLPTFGLALTEFNRRAGEIFAPVQGGPYASPALAELVARVRAEGISGVGQSSWGPTVFAITDPDRAAHLARSLAGEDLEILVTRAANDGSRLEPLAG